MIVIRALAGLHDLLTLLDGLRLGRFQLADLAADWFTEGAYTRLRDRAAEAEARCADPLVLIIADATMPELLRVAAVEEWQRRHPRLDHVVSARAADQERAVDAIAGRDWTRVGLVTSR